MMNNENDNNAPLNNNDSPAPSPPRKRGRKRYSLCEKLAIVRAVNRKVSPWSNLSPASTRYNFRAILIAGSFNFIGQLNMFNLVQLKSPATKIARVDAALKFYFLCHRAAQYREVEKSDKSAPQ